MRATEQPMAIRTNPVRRVRRKLNHDQPTSAITDCSRDDSSARTDREPNSTRFLVALDYGTTYTSVSYLKFNAECPPAEVFPSSIKSVRNWSPVETQRYSPGCPIVPSESWYHNGQYFWGYEVRQRLHNLDVPETGVANSVIRFAKLLLDDDETKDGGELGRIKCALENMGKSPANAVKDYLIKVFVHSREYMHERDGFSRECQIELVLCVPSGWSSRTMFRLQQIVIEAVEETGFAGPEFSVYIVEEPEAAATRALEHPEVKRLIDVSMNCLFIRS